MSWFNGKTDMPDLSVQALAERENINGTWYTPDVNFLETHPYQTLFLWGCDKPGWPFYKEHIEPFIEGSFSVAFTLERFTMVEKETDGGSSLVALRKAYTLVPNCSIRGVVGSIQSKQLYELDKLWLNTVEYTRERVAVTIPFTRYRWTKSQGKLPPIKLITRKKACMYVGKPEFWHDQIDAGYSCQFQPKITSRSPWTEDYIHYDPPPF